MKVTGYFRFNLSSVYLIRTQFSTVIFHSKLYHCVISKVIDTAVKLSLNTIATNAKILLVTSEQGLGSSNVTEATGIRAHFSALVFSRLEFIRLYPQYLVQSLRSGIWVEEASGSRTGDVFCNPTTTQNFA